MLTTNKCIKFQNNIKNNDLLGIKKSGYRINSPADNVAIAAYICTFIEQQVSV
jgi:flagellin-like hook-associated protein FlgL